MSYLDDDGNIVFEAPVSTMNYGSLERGMKSTDIYWPGQNAYNYPLDELARRYYEKDRLEFVCMREILFHGKELAKPLRAGSLDRFWGVKMLWPYKTKKNHRYVFTFQGENPPEPPGNNMEVNDLEMPDAILINSEKYWKRGCGKTLFINIEYIAPEDGLDIEITLIKDRYKCMKDAYSGWGEKSPIAHAICHGYVHLHMGLKYACEHFGLCDKAPTHGEDYKLPSGMRSFKNAGPWQWLEDETYIENKYPKLTKPQYPTDQVVWINLHDIYIDKKCFHKDFSTDGRLCGNAEVMKELVQLSLDNGIYGFVHYNSVLTALEDLGYKNSSEITLWFSGYFLKRTMFTPDGKDILGGLGFALKDSPEELNKYRDANGKILNTQEFQQACRKKDGEKLLSVMQRFPNAPLIYRINEYSGCQYTHVTAIPEDRQKCWPKQWYDFAQAADDINRDALKEIVAPAKKAGQERFSISANVTSAHLVSRPLQDFADFIMEKDIGRICVNIAVAGSRGTNMAFNRKIGLQHDAWGGLNYNRDSAKEVESINRSFFFNGVDVCDAEFGNFALTKDNHGVFNKKGLAWIKVTRLAAIHPKRGQQRVKIGFMKGSDHLWGWYYPLTHTMGIRNIDTFDPKEPKEYIDFELLNIVFPKFGKWHSYNQKRWMTGTPYGPCDLVPWDAPLESLQRYKVLPMLGANRVQKKDWDKYIEYVKSGGIIMFSLYQLLAPDDERVYFKDDVSDLLGIKLGKDQLMDSWENAETLADFQTYISEHYNKIQLCGAEVLGKLPNGDPLVTRFKLGAGYAYFFTTDRLKSVDYIAENIISELFQKHNPLILSKPNDYMEASISEKDDLRLITLMDHGRDCQPTELGTDSGPYCGKVILDLDNLELPENEYEIFEVKTDYLISKLFLELVETVQEKRKLSFNITEMQSYAEFVIGPKGKTQNDFFWK